MARKTFKVKIGELDRELSFKAPGQKDLFSMDLEYRRIYAEALRAGAMTEAEAKASFEKSGAWTKEKAKKIDAIAIQVALLEKQLEATPDKERTKKEKIATDLLESRAEMFELVAQRTSLFDSTAEQFASDQRLHKFIQLCCKDVKDQNIIFEKEFNYETFITEHPDAMTEIYKQAYYFDLDFDESTAGKDWAEVEYLRELNMEEDKKATATKKKTARKKRTTRKKKTTRTSKG